MRALRSRGREMRRALGALEVGLVALGALGLVAVLAGCDDAAGGGGGGDAMGAGGGVPDGGEGPADTGFGGAGGGGGGRRDASPGSDAAHPNDVPAYIDLALTPRQPLYTRDDHPQATAVVYNAYGVALEGVALQWDVQPAGHATLDAERRLTFLLEGQGAVRACLTSALCGRASFFVDDGPPSLVVESPARGALVRGAPEIEVVGRTDADPSVRVLINDAVVPHAADGTFRHTLPARFGLNRLDVLADDGVRRPPTRVVMEVLYAPDVQVAGADRIAVEDAATFRLSQTLLDASRPRPPADELGARRFTDLAGLIMEVLRAAEPLRLLGDPELARGEPLSLRLTDLRLGEPELQIRATDEGLDVFLRLDGLSLHTEGRLDLEGVPVALGGAVLVSAAAYARLAIEANAAGAPVIRLTEADVAIERISGQMEDSTAQAVLDTFGSLLRGVLEAAARDLVAQIIRENIPEFIELGLDDALATLREVPIDAELGDGLPAIRLDLGLGLSAPRARARDAIELGLSAEIRQRGPVVAPHPDPGVPVEALDRAPIWPIAADLGLAVRLSLVNALLHEVWRQSALQLDVTALLPDNLSGLLAEARLDARLQPVVVGTPPGSPFLFELQLGELDLYARGPRAELPDRYVLSVRAGLILEVGDGGVRFDVAERADIRVELLEQQGARPLLTPELLAALIEPLVWPRVREAVGNGLALDLDPIVLDRAAFAEWAPSLRQIRLQPGFPAPPAVRNGWFILSAGLTSVVE